MEQEGITVTDDFTARQEEITRWLNGLKAAAEKEGARATVIGYLRRIIIDGKELQLNEATGDLEERNHTAEERSSGRDDGGGSQKRGG